MPDLVQIRRVMSLQRAMNMYGTTDKEKFECAYPEYEPLRASSTFYADFSVADVFGEKAIQDTFNNAFSNWKSDYKMLTELTGALNHKLWFWHEHGVVEYAELYDRLWKEADAYACSALEGEELKHFMTVLD